MEKSGEPAREEAVEEPVEHREGRRCDVPENGPSSGDCGESANRRGFPLGGTACRVRRGVPEPWRRREREHSAGGGKCRCVKERMRDKSRWGKRRQGDKPPQSTVLRTEPPRSPDIPDSPPSKHCRLSLLTDDPRKAHGGSSEKSSPPPRTLQDSTLARKTSSIAFYE